MSVRYSFFYLSDAIFVEAIKNGFESTFFLGDNVVYRCLLKIITCSVKILITRSNQGKVLETGGRGVVANFRMKEAGLAFLLRSKTR